MNKKKFEFPDENGYCIPDHQLYKLVTSVDVNALFQAPTSSIFQSNLSTPEASAHIALWLLYHDDPFHVLAFVPIDVPFI